MAASQGRPSYQLAAGISLMGSRKGQAQTIFIGLLNNRALESLDNVSIADIEKLAMQKN